MTKFSKILQIKDEERRDILAEYNLTEEEFQENIEIIRKWIMQSGHLPNNIDDNFISVALLNSKMNLEKTKQSIEGFYRMKSIYGKEFFDNITPASEAYEIAKKMSLSIVLPKLTPNLCRITISKLTDPDGLAPSPFYYYFISVILTEIRMRNDFFLSNIIIGDLKTASWKNLVKYTPNVNHCLLQIFKAVNLRIHAIHLVNLPEYSDAVIKLIKMTVPSKIFGKIYTHKTFESLHEHIPPEYLPSNYGGTLESVEESYKNLCETIEEAKEFFIEIQKMKSTKKYEIDPYQKELFGIGMEGTFKQLAID